MSSKLHTFWLIAALAKRRKRGVETVWGMGGHLSSLSCGSRSTPRSTPTTSVHRNLLDLYPDP